MKLIFNENYNVDDFNFVLSTRNHTHLGGLSNVTDTHFKNNLYAKEISFNVYKELNGHKERLWDKIDNLKLVYIKECDTYFSIVVTSNDNLATYKTITGTSLCESELGQIYLYGIEINTEDDIARSDYVITKFYDPENPKASFLNRIFSKAPHYYIKYVDASLMNLQRSFSIDGTSIYDFLTGECAEQFNCLFIFDTTDRSVSVYDLYTTCNECGYRGEYYNICPECGSTDLKYYGKDTTIFVDKENLADSIELSTDVDGIKNCFRLEAGDDKMTATVVGNNPNGTAYIYHISDFQKKDMSQELNERIMAYDELYDSKQEEYSNVMKEIYECIDKILYYTSEMMPTIEHEETKAVDEAAKLTVENMSPIGLANVTSSTSIATVNSALKNYASIYIKTGYFKVELNESSFQFIGLDGNGDNYGEWTGNFKVTNYSDEEDVAISPTITVKVTENYQTFLEQKIKKSIAKDSENEDSIYDVLGIKDLEKFKEALTYYCLNRLTSFYDAIESVIDIMIEEDQSSEGADLYKSLYEPYYNKLIACQSEIDKRQTTIDEWQYKYDNFTLQKEELQAELNFEDFLGEELYKEFCAYRREDTYSNSNYISDGLDNTELFEKAQDFLEVAKKELLKASEGKKSISTELKNLLVMEEFKPIVNNFEIGNWIRVGVDDEIYRLRLISYEINFGSIQTLNVEFSELTKIGSVANEIESILKSAQSMSSNFSYISKQAEKGNITSEEFNDWVQNGLDSSLVQIKNNDNEEIIYNKHGLLARQWDEVTESYSDEQLKVAHNILCFTKDNWKTASLGLGKHKYKYYDSELHNFKEEIDYGLSAKFVSAGYIYGSQLIGGEIYSDNYSSTAGSHLNLNDGSFSFAGGKLTYDGDEINLSGIISADSGYIGSDKYQYRWIIGNDSSRAYIYNGTDSMDSTTVGTYIGTDGFRNYGEDAYLNIYNGIFECFNSNGNKSVEIKNNHINIYGWWDESSSNNIIGSIGSTYNVTDKTRGGLVITGQGTSSVGIGYVDENENITSAITINPEKIKNGEPPFIKNGQSGTISFISGINWSYNDNAVTKINSITRTTVTFKYGLLTGWSSETTNY